MEGTTHAPFLARFDDFEVDFQSGELRKNGEKIKLPDQSFKILAMLLETHGRVVSRGEIQKQLWRNDTVVEFENSINSAIKKLRLALGDSAEEPKYIETLARRGYRWLAPVQWGSPATAPSVQRVSSHLIGKRISHYRVLDIIGGGGMGIVYKAEDIKLGRRVALKFLPEELATENAAMQRFEREARAASSLNHPNICTIYEVGEFDGQPFLAMEFLEGQTLRELISADKDLRNTPFLQVKTILELSIQIANGLEAAHKQGIIHRDIKPANIFVTNHGRVKILDFGLAKLQESELWSSPLPCVGTEVLPQPWDPNITLTRTGTTMGTAGYMSPEQIKGEKVDARSDLFSFGLVLYEMATGQRAFTGETAPVLRAAILNETPNAVRQLNPEIPTKLEKIITRALEKDCESRSQSASEMEVELRKLGAISKRAPFSRGLAIAAAGALLVVALILWFVKRQPGLKLDLKQRQLTTNSNENAVVSGAISSDGKYLAYADLQGMHVKVIETGEGLTVPQPEVFKGFQVNWGIVPTWVPDESGFVANANIPGQRRSIWLIPARGGSPRKLRDDASAWSVSRDGSWIAFSTNEGPFGDREMWRLSPDGEKAEKLYEAGQNSSFTGAEWSPDGKRLSYVRFREMPEEAEFDIQSQDVRGGATATAVPGFEMDYTWSPDGRIIYSREEPGSAGESCNFWGVRINSRTGEPIEEPKRWTNWAGFCMDNPSVTADGKRMTFRRWLPQGSVFVSDLEASGTRISTPKRLTLNDELNYPAAWTSDSKAVVFRSYRDGQWRILKQNLNEENGKTIVSGADAGSAMGARISPDGAWLLYTAPLPENSSTSERSILRRLMRVSMRGGPAELVFNVRLPDYGVYNDPVCARAPSTLCVITEQTADRKQLIFTAFDPIRGRGRELARYEITWPGAYDWDLSPDGSRLAISKYSEQRIHIVSLNDQHATDIVVKGSNGLQSLNWAADGKGLFVSMATETGSSLLHIDLKGNARVLWKQRGSIAPWGLPFDLFIGPSAPWAVPSPDGRHLAIYEWKLNSNIWMMENF